MNIYQPNPVGEALKEINDQYIEDNLNILEDYFLKNDERGMMCNKDNVEDEYDRWLSYMEYPDLVKIIWDSKKDEVERYEHEMESTRNYMFNNGNHL